MCDMEGRKPMRSSLSLWAIGAQSHWEPLKSPVDRGSHLFRGRMGMLGILPLTPVPYRL